jgi:hypothetical protein
MYKVDVIQVDRNTYIIPTNDRFNDFIGCYVFVGNMFNYIVKYSCEKYYSSHKVVTSRVLNDCLYMTDEDVAALHGLERWNEIAKYFKKDVDN